MNEIIKSETAQIKVIIFINNENVLKKMNNNLLNPVNPS